MPELTEPPKAALPDLSSKTRIYKGKDAWDPHLSVIALFLDVSGNFQSSVDWSSIDPGINSGGAKWWIWWSKAEINVKLRVCTRIWSFSDITHTQKSTGYNAETGVFNGPHFLKSIFSLKRWQLSWSEEVTPLDVSTTNILCFYCTYKPYCVPGTMVMPGVQT